MNTICSCRAGGCPVHPGKICRAFATTLLYPKTRDTTKGRPFCALCAEEWVAAGASRLPKWKRATNGSHREVRLP